MFCCAWTTSGVGPPQPGAALTTGTDHCLGMKGIVGAGKGAGGCAVGGCKPGVSTGADEAEPTDQGSWYGVAGGLDAASNCAPVGAAATGLPAATRGWVAAGAGPVLARAPVVGIGHPHGSVATPGSTPNVCWVWLTRSAIAGLGTADVSGGTSAGLVRAAPASATLPSLEPPASATLPPPEMF